MRDGEDLYKHSMVCSDQSLTDPSSDDVSTSIESSGCTSTFEMAREWPRKV